MNTSSDKIQQAREAYASALEYFIKFVYYIVQAVGFTMQSLYIWCKNEYMDRTISQKMKMDDTVIG